MHPGHSDFLHLARTLQCPRRLQGLEHWAPAGVNRVLRVIHSPACLVMGWYICWGATGRVQLYHECETDHPKQIQYTNVQVLRRKPTFTWVSVWQTNIFHRAFEIIEPTLIQGIPPNRAEEENSRELEASSSKTPCSYRESSIFFCAEGVS